MISATNDILFNKEKLRKWKKKEKKNGVTDVSTLKDGCGQVEIFASGALTPPTRSKGADLVTIPNERVGEPAADFLEVLELAHFLQLVTAYHTSNSQLEFLIFSCRLDCSVFINKQRERASYGKTKVFLCKKNQQNNEKIGLIAPAATFLMELSLKTSTKLLKVVSLLEKSSPLLLIPEPITIPPFLSIRTWYSPQAICLIKVSDLFVILFRGDLLDVSVIEQHSRSFNYSHFSVA